MAESNKRFARLSGRSLAALIRQVARTSEVVRDPPDLMQQIYDAHPSILAFWHGQFMMLPSLRTQSQKVSAMVARHGDAEVIGEALKAFNIELIRGAGAGERKRDRGGATAMRATIDALADETTVSMTADVPPGPARVAGPGIIATARYAGRPIMPLAVATRRFVSFDTWSRMTINLPYSKLAFVLAEPVVVPQDADDAMLEQKRLELETKLNDATARAYDLAGADIRRATPLHILAATTPPKPGLALKIYGAGTSALRPAVSVLLDARGRQGKEDANRRGERLGIAGRLRPDGDIAWIHAASVGETNAVLPLIDHLLAADASLSILLTTGTTTSADIAARRLPDRAFHQYVPLDVPQYVAKFLDYWRPKISIFTESDVWPNLVLATAERRIPLVLVNARLSPRSISRWRKFGRVGRPLFSRFSVILAQNSQVARAFKRLGAPNVVTAGNLKIDAPAPPVDATALAALKTAISDRPVFVAASTHPGEDAIIAAAHALMRDSVDGLLTIIVPRHPQRGPEIAASLANLGLKTQLRTELATPEKSTGIYIADTIGELGTFYAAAPIALVGGSLVEKGGQNPIEAVRSHACVLTGPFTHNFRDAYAALLREGGAVEVRSSDDIARQVIKLLSDKLAAERMRTNADRAVASLGGALETTLTAIQPLLNETGN